MEKGNQILCKLFYCVNNIFTWMIFFFFLAKYTILTKLAWGLGLHSTALLFNFLDKKIIY